MTITALAIYPLVVVLFGLVSALFGTLSVSPRQPLRVLAMVTLLVPLTWFAAVPALARLLSCWLYRYEARSRSSGWRADMGPGTFEQRGGMGRSSG